MNEEELLLLKLHLCGLDLKNELQVANFLLTHESIPTRQELWTLLELSASKKEDLLTELASQTLKQKLEENLTQAKVLTILNSQYPEQLRESYRPPTVLFYQGDITLLERPLFGVVGARENTSYAYDALKRLLPPVVKQKLALVSGLAKGVDGLAQRLTLELSGKTIAVIGNGLDISYPNENKALQEQIGQAGLLLSEYAIGSPPLRYHFPMRNRIIAGLVKVLLVVEARHHSGSLITANLALQENREVLALPGRINDPLSQGCNELIAAGAKVVLTANDILEEIF